MFLEQVLGFILIFLAYSITNSVFIFVIIMIALESGFLMTEIIIIKSLQLHAFSFNIITAFSSLRSSLVSRKVVKCGNFKKIQEEARKLN